MFLVFLLDSQWRYLDRWGMQNFLVIGKLIYPMIGCLRYIKVIQLNTNKVWLTICVA